MKIENIDIQATIEKAQALVRDDEHLSVATKSMFEILILVITLLANRLNLNSTNSSKPPSGDGFGKRTQSQRGKSDKSCGGQPGHPGSTLEWSLEVDWVELHQVSDCASCGASLRDVAVEAILQRHS